MPRDWPLQAEMRLALSDAAVLLDALCGQMADYAEIERHGTLASLTLDYGFASAEAGPAELRVKVAAEDETSFAFMKMAVAEHLVQLGPSPLPAIAWDGDGCGDAVPPFFREMRVLRTAQVTPRMRRVTLQGDNLVRFAQGGLHLRLLLPPKGRAPVWPSLGPDGRLRMPQGEDALVSRVYTIRRIDLLAGEIDIDMVVHTGENMPGAEFAVGAQSGDVVGITGPGGGFVPKAERLFLFGDETALPAIGRILEALEPAVEARAFVEIAHADERQALACSSAASIEWLIREESDREGERLVDAVRRHVGPEEAKAFVWAAGEFSAFKAIRSHLRKTLGRRKDDHLVVSYWRHGVCGDGRRYEK